MKQIVRTVLLAVSVAAAASAAGQTAKAPEAGAATQDSPLVKAAKANGGGKTMPKKPITNADVKKSTGKLIEKPAEGAPASTPAGPPASSLAIHEAQKKALAAAQKKVTEHEAKVAELEKELNRVEQSYYEASDPNLRDKIIAPRFEATKKQFDAAQAALTDARAALAELLPKPPPPAQ